VLFDEPNEEQYLRRETIRSLINYNLDNLADRRDQRRVSASIQNAIDSILEPLLRDEILITARTEFAQKLAWREYSKLIQSDFYDEEILGSNYLERLILGEKIGPVQLNEKDLLGLHSDLEYINKQLGQWSELNEESRAFVYFQLYRIVEYIFRDIFIVLKLPNDDTDFNLYDSINFLHANNYLSDDGKTAMHNLRYRRNKLMHEPGVSLDVSRENIEEVIDEVNKILTKLLDEHPEN
jgi:hypothetical protein